MPASYSNGLYKVMPYCNTTHLHSDRLILSCAGLFTWTSCAACICGTQAPPYQMLVACCAGLWHNMGVNHQELQ